MDALTSLEQPPCVDCGFRGYAQRRRGLCRACYQRHWLKGTLSTFPKQQRPTTCDRCKRPATPRKRGMCHTCYIRWWRARRVSGT